MSVLEKSLHMLFKKGEKSDQQRLMWDAFIQQGLPLPNEDQFRYLPMESLYQETLSHLTDLSYGFSVPDGVVALPLSEAKSRYGSLFFSQREKNPFVSLSKALTEEGLFLYVPPNTVLDRPLDLTLIGADALCLPQLVLFVGEGSQVKVRRKTTAQNWLISSSEIALEKGAQLFLEEELEVEEKARFFGTLNCRIYEDAIFQAHTFRTGKGIAREDATVALKGERAEAMLKGAALLKDCSEHHVQILAHHFAPHTRSHQHYKNILEDRSRASFEGKIYVEKEALKTDAYQLVNHLLLSPKASAFSKPNLEIFADDVKASHGATLSEVNRHYLHYFKTRGIDQKEGEQMLLKAFLLSLFEETALHKKVADHL